VHRGWKAAAAAATPAPTPEKKIEQLAKGQRAAVSSSGSGGGGADPEMTLAGLLALEGAAFDAAFEKHGKRLMGG
jgi:hypothetical protein